MSRIQMILEKAEREGTARRFNPDDPRALHAVVPVREQRSQEPDAADDDAQMPPAVAHVARPGPTPVFDPPVPIEPIGPVGTIEPRSTEAVEVKAPAPTEAEGPEEAERTEEREETAPGAFAADAMLPQSSANGEASHRLPLAPALIAALHPNALASEQFRTLRTRIANSANGRGARALLLTSPGRGDGKSVMAANLALTMGQEIQQRVCLVDASLRDARVHELFGLPESPGLVEVLNGTATLDDALVLLEEHQLTVLPAGQLPRHPAELLASRDMRRILDELRSRFDRVVIDAPPAMPMADVSILTPLVDGVLVVVRAGVTETPALQAALGGLDAQRVLGVVLNDVQD